MIDDFIAVLEAGARLNLISFDEATVRAPHHDVTMFDADALAADATRLRAVAARLDAGPVREAGRTFGDDWHGVGGDAALTVARSTTSRVADAITELSACAAELDRTVTAVDDILARYRGAMSTVCDPTIVGQGVSSADDVRSELIARMEYADAAGRTASAALVDVARVSASSGELVLAGDR